ncbi:hypothetical protein [Microbacterium elymi]|uniref:Uncharacterized protein n=1 Tax=Microbacterium elymi TaxID=2909587 RepID=A0ABY5NL31_9MICO|nr:hypothetical protein [Microbacterium elymi]UUT35884.1 hypothetical protein L2X98_22260 [Microbacterium elymi]
MRTLRRRQLSHLHVGPGDPDDTCSAGTRSDHVTCADDVAVARSVHIAVARSVHVAEPERLGDPRPDRFAQPRPQRLAQPDR